MRDRRGGGSAFAIFAMAMCAFPASILLAAAAPTPIRDAAPWDSLLRGKYLDMDCYVAGLGAKGSGCFVSRSVRNSLKFPLYLRAFGVTQAELLERGDSLVTDRIAQTLDSSRQVGAAVLLALDGVIGSDGRIDSQQTQVFVPDSFVLRETRRHPRLLYGASINPKRRDAIALLEQAKRDGAVLVKWIPGMQFFDPADSAFIPFYRALKRLRLPLLVHTGDEGGFNAARNALGDPRRLKLALDLGVTVIAGHAAANGKSEGQDNMDRLLAMFPPYPNLYTDISSLTQINKSGALTKLLARPEARHRLLYGTDYPLIQTWLVSPYYFPLTLSLMQMRALSRISNPWDQDVALKKALGVPEEVFQLPAQLLAPKTTSSTKMKSHAKSQVKPRRRALRASAVSGDR